MATSSSGASINGVTIRPPASSEVVVGATLRATAESPTVAGSTPRSAAANAAFVFLDPRTPEFLIPLNKRSSQTIEEQPKGRMSKGCSKMVKERSDKRKPLGSKDKEKIRTKSDR